jgi:hypothetical protein
MSASAHQKVDNKLSIEEIDIFLTSISNGLKHGKKPDKELAMKKANKLLDLRLELTKGGENE